MCIQQQQHEIIGRDGEKRRYWGKLCLVCVTPSCFLVEITQNPFWLPEGGTVASKAVIMHPDYNTRALRRRNVTEFYDYDIALVQINESIPLSWKAR